MKCIVGQIRTGGIDVSISHISDMSGCCSSSFSLFLSAVFFSYSSTIAFETRLSIFSEVITEVFIVILVLSRGIA